MVKSTYLYIFISIYLIGVLIYIGAFIQNLSVTHTYFSSLGSPGDELVSYRGTFVDVSIRLTVLAHIFNVAFILMMIAYKEKNTCYIVWFSLYVVAFIMIFMGFSAMTNEYWYCNGQNQQGNICNSLVWCGPVEIQSNLANGCPNPLPYSDPIILLGELRPREDFVGLYWLNFILFIMSLGFIIAMIVFWKRREEEEEEVEEKEEEKEEERNILPPKKEFEIPTAPDPIIIAKKSHGLRQRK